MSTYGMTDRDREFVLGRLDREHINELAENARISLGLGLAAVELCYQPGDATWYSITIAPISDLRGASGGGTGGAPTSYLGDATHLIVYAQRETVAWCDPERDDLEWVANKLTDNTASALAIAELLKEVFSE